MKESDTPEWWPVHLFDGDKAAWREHQAVMERIGSGWYAEQGRMFDEYREQQDWIDDVWWHVKDWWGRA